MNLTDKDRANTAYGLGFVDGKMYAAQECVDIIQSFKYKMDSGPDHIIALINQRFGLDET